MLALGAAATSAAALLLPTEERTFNVAEFLPDVIDAWPPRSAAITFATPAEARERRERLRRLAFGRRTLPTRLPLVEQGVVEPELAAGLANLERIDRLTIAFPQGFTSVVLHVVPSRPNGRLLIFHDGHSTRRFEGKANVAYFLERGYSVLFFAMPLIPPNTNPTELATTRCGRVEIRSNGHEILACLKQTLRYFLEPVAVALNYATKLGYEDADMVGLSGGGWTTVVYAALDTRVRRSYPVAGSLPVHVRMRSCDDSATAVDCLGDFEQRMPALLRIANYPELYALGAWGPGRRQLAVFNVHDPENFSGRSYREWAPGVQAAVQRLGSGAFAALGDTTLAAHVVSPFALKTIERDLRDDRAQRR